MKKLLALILCVMMFVAVVPTAAFAADAPQQQSKWAGASTQNNIHDMLQSNIQNMYGAMAADTAVYNTVKGIDDIVKDLASGFLKDYAPNPNGTGIQEKTIEDAIVSSLRATVGGEISKYLDDHRNEYMSVDKAGNRVFDAMKYAGVFSKAASNAMSSEKAVKGIQNYALLAVQATAYESLAQQAFDLRNDLDSFDHWGDYGFDDANTAWKDWNVPNANGDGTMHTILPNYDTYLNGASQVGGATIHWTYDGTGVVAPDGTMWMTNPAGALYQNVDQGPNP
jgi:hypothetical protein